LTGNALHGRIMRRTAWKKKETDMISGRKLAKIGWLMISIPFIAIFVMIIIYVVVSGGKYHDNVLVNTAAGFMVFIMVLGIIPLAAGLVKMVVEKIARKREDVSANRK
jgi:hypothetical protein